MAYETRIFGTSRGAAFVNIKVALPKWLKNTILLKNIQQDNWPLTTDMLKMAFVEKKLVMRYFNMNHYPAIFCHC